MGVEYLESARGNFSANAFETFLVDLFLGLCLSHRGVRTFEKKVVGAGSRI